jgi:hypothetical protein
MPKSRDSIGGPFVPLLKETLAAPAWRATSHGARSLYVALKLRYSSNFKNNGKIFLSSRDAEAELGSNRDSVLRWFRELQYYGFIVMTNPGALGVNGKGKAPHWRLTELGYMKDEPTKDFLHWNKVPFQDGKKQNPGPNSGATLVAKVGPVLAPIVGPPPEPSGPESGAMCCDTAGPKSGAISRLTILSAVSEGSEQAEELPPWQEADSNGREAA